MFDLPGNQVNPLTLGNCDPKSSLQKKQTSKTKQNNNEDNLAYVCRSCNKILMSAFGQCLVNSWFIVKASCLYMLGLNATIIHLKSVQAFTWQFGLKCVSSYAEEHWKGKDYLKLREILMFLHHFYSL